MSEPLEQLATHAREILGGVVLSSEIAFGELTLGIRRDDFGKTCRVLRDHTLFRFEQLIDVCGVDYLSYRAEAGEPPCTDQRFAAIYHLLSVSRNQRVRLRVFADGEPPAVESVTEIWPSANWFERETFDLYGIVFEGHPDLRRLLTDYGFIGHPFRKDFPLSGHVEMRYDPEKRRVVYQPVSIEPRINVPRVIREDGFGKN
jgi:NADH-quinone oxidoreductase subunit C